MTIIIKYDRIKENERSSKMYTELDYAIKLDFNGKEKTEEVQKLLADVGVKLVIKERPDFNLLRIIVDNDYTNKKTRKAGRKTKTSTYTVCDGMECAYKYSDIVYMMQTMTDKDIAIKIDMPIATYYRHKRKLMQSQYYQQLDPDKLQDELYLKNMLDDVF